MRKRWFTLINAATLTDSQTFIQNLIGLGKIYALRVNYSGTNGATSNTVGNIHSMVSKLQVLDGSRVLHSLSMSEEMAVNCYRRGRFPSAVLTLDAAGLIDEDCFIDFNLDEGDDEHYIDTGNYSSPFLSFTHALTISATAGFATGTGKLTVEALMPVDNPPATKGFLMAKEFATYTPATSGVRSDLLPLDLPYAALLNLTGVNTKNPITAITNLKLTIDNDTVILFNRPTKQMVRELRSKYAPFIEEFNPIVGGTADTIPTDLYDLVSAYVGPAGATAKSVLTAASVNQLTTAKTTGETVAQVISAKGYLPFGAIYMPFGSGKDPQDFLDPTSFKKLDYQSTQGEADSTQIVTLQLAPR